MSNYMDLFHEKNGDFSNDDKLQIRKSIKATYDKILESRSNAETDYITSIGEADHLQSILEQNGYDVESLSSSEIEDLPAYLNVTEHPADIRKAAEDAKEEALSNVKTDEKELFDNVFEINKTTNILDPNTISYLGTDYDTYANERFNKEVDMIKNEHQNDGFTRLSTEEAEEASALFDPVGMSVTIHQKDPSYGNVGEKLSSKGSIMNIKGLIGDSVGAPDDFDMNLIIFPNGNKGFDVIYDDVSIDPADVVEAVYDEMESHDLLISDFEHDLPEKLSKSDMTDIFNEIDMTTYTQDDQNAKISNYAFEHERAVMQAGFDADGYNLDGFDKTGHSADGEYNGVYDEAYTSPDL